MILMKVKFKLFSLWCIRCEYVVVPLSGGSASSNFVLECKFAVGFTHTRWCPARCCGTPTETKWYGSEHLKKHW
jgi:hypothetical protein